MREAFREAAVLAVTVLLGGCSGWGIGDPEGVLIINDTPEAVEVFYVQAGVERDVGGIGAEGEGIYSLDLFERGNEENCTRGVLIVRKRDGSEVARIPPPVCDEKKIQLSMWPHD